jgi:hypothetical protein
MRPVSARSRLFSRSQLGVALLVLAMSWPGLAAGEPRQREANLKFASHPLDTRGQGNMGQPMMRDPFGFDKDRSRSETGNQGRPCMREPFGHDQDRSRLLTGNQGRAFGECDAEAVVTPPAPTPEPEPAPEPEPIPEPSPAPAPTEPVSEEPVVTEPTPEPVSEDPVVTEPTPTEPVSEEPIVTEPAPEPVATEPTPSEPTPAPTSNLHVTNPVVHWTWGIKEDAVSQMHKRVQWQYPVEEAVAAFKVYEQYPGESGYHLYQTIDMSWGDGVHTIEWREPSQRYIDEYRLYNEYLFVYLNTSLGVVQLNESRNCVLNDWPVGTYRHYVVPVDAQGHEGPRVDFGLATMLPPLDMTHPTDGSTVESMPFFQWTDVVQSLRLEFSPVSSEHYTVFLYDYTQIHTLREPPLTYFWRKTVSGPLTAVLYDGPPLVAGHDYRVVVIGGVYESRPLEEQRFGIAASVMPRPRRFFVGQ